MTKEIKVNECPIKKTNKVKDSKCKKCEHYNPKRWFTSSGEVDVFCSLQMHDGEKKYLK